MSNNRIAKIIRVGTSLAIVLPAGLCRELNIIRGTLFGIIVNTPDILSLHKVKVVDENNTGELKDNSVPMIKNG